MITNIDTIPFYLTNEVANFLDRYQEFTKTTAIYPDVGKKTERELFYLFCGLTGEELEWFDSNYDIKEAGDVFWYLSQLCTYFNTTLYLLFKVTEIGQKKRPNIHESIKKHIRDNKDILFPMWEYMKSILGYILYRYYYSVNNPPLEETIKLIIMQNVDKLTDRKNRSVLRGDGETIEERLYNKSFT